MTDRDERRPSDAPGDRDPAKRDVGASRGIGVGRLLPYVPPLAAVFVAAGAITVAHARPVFGARVIAGGLPDAGTALTARAIVVRHDGLGLGYVAQVEVRLVGDGVHGQASVTDQEGVSELRLEPPLPRAFAVEGKIGGLWLPLADVQVASIPPRDPRLGQLPAARSFGRAAGQLVVAAAPERSALVPQAACAAWVRVQRKTPHGLSPVEGAHLAIEAVAGVESIDHDAITDVGGLARVHLTPSAPPAIVNVKATEGDLEGSWEGTLGAVYATPYPTGDGSVAIGAKGIDVAAPAPITRAYYDLWHDGVRAEGGALRFGADRTAKVPLPSGAAGEYDLEISSSPDPQPSDDLSHAIAWPIVVARDPIEGLSAIAGDPRFDRALPPPTGSARPWGAALPATIAFARAAIPPRAVVATGLEAAFRAEEARGGRVRRWATIAILAAALVEIAIVLRLGLFSRSAHVEDEIDALVREGEEEDARRAGTRGGSEGEAGRDPHRARRLASAVLGALGTVVMIFAALAIMAAGLR